MSALRLIQGLILVCALTAGTLQAKAPEAADPLAGTTHETGFVDVYRDANRGKVLIGVHDLDQPFLLVTSLPGGLGSNDVGLDRGQLGKQYIARFRRVGERLLLIADNTRYVANSSDADEQRSAVDAFTTSVLWAGPIVKRAAQPGEPPMVLVDIAPYLAGDRHGIATSLAGRDGKGKIQRRCGAQRGAPRGRGEVLPRQHRDGSAADLQRPGQGPVRPPTSPWTRRALNHAAAHPAWYACPTPGFVPRHYHPGSGGFNVSTSPTSRNRSRRAWTCATRSVSPAGEDPI